MNNYNSIVLVHDGQETYITYEEYVMYMASPEKNYDCIKFKKWDKIHRLDGAAVIWYDGTNEWLSAGKYHRLDGPAVECSNGHMEWWVNGKRHRLDGPAVIWPNRAKSWYVNGIRYFERAHAQAAADYRRVHGKLR